MISVCLLKLVKANEDLDRENKCLKESTKSQSNDIDCASLVDEIRHLQAQNTVLQNSLFGRNFLKYLYCFNQCGFSLQTRFFLLTY